MMYVVIRTTLQLSNIIAGVSLDRVRCWHTVFACWKLVCRRI